ncbi:MAG: hypothetical protein JXB30_00475 [Anaerolineae bacterium]|nr:hypothetical protein [Anaerolineae bacterium]
MLEKLTIRDDLSPVKQAQLRREIAHAGRVEFTILTGRGQDKGHAIVSDDLDADFLIPQDTKGKVTLESGKTWVGIDFVHGKDHMRIDIQSLINLHPFFENTQYAQWLNDEGEVFIQAVKSGDVAEPMTRIDREETLEDVQAWALREFFASGGHPQWFQYHTKSLVNRYLERLSAAAKGKLRIPIPGGRYYVMPAGVGKATGVDVPIEPGQIHIDHQRGTAWVSDTDWLSFRDSPKGEGIAGILGGADNDDALWLHPFTDHDGARKVLAWRSLNQAGEYVRLEAVGSSRIPEWQTAGGEMIAFPPGNSRKLPPRVDHLMPEYQGLVDHSTGGGGAGDRRVVLVGSHGSRHRQGYRQPRRAGDVLQLADAQQGQLGRLARSPIRAAGRHPAHASSTRQEDRGGAAHHHPARGDDERLYGRDADIR